MSGRYSKLKSQVIFQQIKDLHSKNLSINEIAEKLACDVRTVRDYVAKIVIEPDTVDSHYKGTDSTLEQELKSVREKIKSLVEQDIPPHLSIRALSDREIQLLEQLRQVKILNAPEERYVNKSNLTDDQADCIANVITGDIDISQPHWQRILNKI